jgi:quercetin dioxygenase-like cupin family protein
VSSYGLVRDLRAEVEVPAGGILSRQVFSDERIGLTLFAFDAGQELSAHTSARAAIVEILEGEAEVGLDGDVHALAAGAWLAMPPGLPHSIRAVTPLKLALTLL